MTPRLLTTTDVARMHGVSTQSVRRWRALGWLVPVAVAQSATGTIWFFDEATARAYKPEGSGTHMKIKAANRSEK